MRHSHSVELPSLSQYVCSLWNLSERRTSSPHFHLLTRATPSISRSAHSWVAGATKPARNLTKLSTPFSRSPTKHWPSASFPSPKKSPATPSTPVCPSRAFPFLKPTKPSRNCAKLNLPNLTIPRKTLGIRLCGPAGKKFPLVARSVVHRAALRPRISRTDPNRIERSCRIGDPVQPNRAEHRRTLRTPLLVRR